MGNLTHEDFRKFLEYYEDKTCEDKGRIYNCHDKIEELSRSGTAKADSLVPHPQEMYGLDRMVLFSKKLNQEPPKSTDALFFRQNYDGNYALHIIEFKFLGYTHLDRINDLLVDVNKRLSCENSQNLENNSENEDNDDTLENNDLIDNSENSKSDDCDDKECFNESFIKNLKKVKKDFEDPVKVSLQLKPYEVIFITLPMLYEEYCEENPSVTKKDIDSYLRSIDKYYWAFVGNSSPSSHGIRYKASLLNNYSSRLEMTIFKKARVKPKEEFEEVLEREIFENYNYKLF